MAGLASDLPSLHKAINRPPLSIVAKILSVIYGSMVTARAGAYTWGLFKGKRLPGFVMSIGNITVGGTGKTPAVLMLAEWARKQNYRVAVLSRGYKGRFEGDVLEVSDGKSVKARPSESGDEPYMMARRLENIPVIVSKSRLLAGQYAHEKFQSDFFLLDDGFQHLGLHRDLDVVLLDSHNPFGNGYVLPYGRLREPISALKRANVFVITRSVDDSSYEKLATKLHEKFPGKPVFRSKHIPRSFVLPDSSVSTNDVSILKDKRVVAFSGIANSRPFVQTLQQIGTEVVEFRDFGDHHVYSLDELEGLIRLSESVRADYMVTTEKDWVKMESMGIHKENIGYLTIEFQIMDREKEFFGFIKSQVGQLVL